MSIPTPTVSITIGSAGAVPTPPAQLNQLLINTVAADNPGYTVLPAGLIEDISSTDTFAIALIESAAIDLINSISPFTANTWLLIQLGQVYGVPQGQDTNTSVLVVFSGTPGFSIGPGFTVGDGTHQYALSENTIVGQSGQSAPVLAVATVAGSWAVPENTVTALISSVPSSVTLSVTNPNTGTPSPGVQTEEEYRAAVLQAGIAPSQGCASLAKSLLGDVPGVQPRLVSVAQINGGGWEVIVGGGDPFAVAQAIYDSGLDISTLVGSTIGITNISKVNPGVVTTNLNHGLTTGQNNVFISGIQAGSMTQANGGPYTVTVVNENQFTFGVNTTGFTTFVNGLGGTVMPNNRNVTVNINDYPDVYTIPIVDPPQQSVTIQLTWNSNSPFLVSDAAVAQLGAPALVNYVNSIAVGAPINLFELQAVFQEAVASLIPTQNLTRMLFTVSINGVAVDPEVGTGIIAGDPESFFFMAVGDVTITQG